MKHSDGSGPPLPSPSVLSAAAIEAMAGVDKVHFLNANGRRNNKSLGDATGITGFGIHLIEIPAGADSTEYHRHFQEDEAVYVLSGRGVAVLDEQAHPIGPGDFVGLPAGGPAHLLHNPGPDPLRCLVVGGRLAHDVADYPRLQKRIYRNAGAWNLVDHEAIIDPKAGPGSRVGSK